MRDGKTKNSPARPDAATREWERDYAAQCGSPRQRHNRSGIEIKPLYGPPTAGETDVAARLGLPGQFPMTRGVYASMYRGQPWSQRQIVGLGLPADYNARERELIAGGSTGAYLSPCNSFMRDSFTICSIVHP